MDISNISGYIDAVKGNAKTQDTVKRLQDKLNEASTSDAEDKKMKEVCKEFEAYFIEQIYKEMWNTVPKEEKQDAALGQLTDYFRDMYTQELAKQTAEQESLGIAQQLYEAMKRDYEI